MFDQQSDNSSPPSQPPSNQAPPRPPEPLPLGAMYIGLNAARAMATSVGWSRSQTIIAVQISLVAGVLASFAASDAPYSRTKFMLMVVGCAVGLIVNIAWWAIVQRTGTWTSFFNDSLQRIEQLGAPILVFESQRFSDTAARWGARNTLRFFILLATLFWILILAYIIDSQYPSLFRHLIEKVSDTITQLTQWRPKWQ